MRNKDPMFDPSCCSYQLSSNTKGHIEKLIKSEDVDKDTRNKLVELREENEANKALSYKSLTELHKYLQRANPDRYLEPFYIFQDKCKCIKPKPRDNKVLESRLRLLRFESSKALYNKMVTTVDRLAEKQQDDDSAAGGAGIVKELRVFNGSMVAVLNSFLVYICTFVFCYKALEYALPQPHIIGQTLFGLLGSSIVACAELYFLARVI